MKLIRKRDTGDLFYFAEELAKRDDIDIVEGEVQNVDGISTLVETGTQRREPERQASEPPADTQKVVKPKPLRVNAPVVTVVKEGGGVDTGGTGIQEHGEEK